MKVLHRVGHPAALFATIDLFLLMYVILMLHSDGAWDEQHATDITQRSQAMNNDPETYYPTQSISAGSFRAESKSKVRLFFFPFYFLF